MNHEVCGFEHLHRHSDFSLLDGFATVEEYGQYSKEVNQKFLCISDHGVMGSVPQQIRVSEEYGLEPIFACLVEGAPIYTNLGVKRIEDIRVGDMVLTHKGRYKKVKKTMFRDYEGDLYALKLSGSQNDRNFVFFTAEHPILIKNKNEIEWTKISEVKYGKKNKWGSIHNYHSYVCFPKFINNKLIVLNFRDFLDERFVVEENKIFKKELNTYFSWSFPTSILINEDFAYFLGLYCAEGSVHHKNGKIDGSFRFSLNRSETELVDKITSLLKNIFGLKSSVCLKHKSKSMDLYSSCIPLAIMLANLCGVGSKCKKIPAQIFDSPLNIQKSFIEGLLDGDGKKIIKSNVSKQKTLKTASFELNYGFKRLLANLNTWGSVGKVANKEHYFTAYSPYRKYNRFLYDDIYVYKPITDIIKKSNQKIKVFNFEVEEDNSYVTDFAVHNCEMYICPLQFESKNRDENKSFFASLSEEDKPRFAKSNHILAIASNEIGYKNLVRLSSWGWIHGFYRKPRINHEVLQKYKEGIIFTTGCANSEIAQAFLRNYNDEEGFAMLEKYLEMLGRENFYLELMMLDFKLQKPYDAFLIRAHNKYNLPFIITQDCHYCRKEHSFNQQLMLMMQNQRTLQEIEILKQTQTDLFELQDQNLWMKSEWELDEMWEREYKDIIDYEIYKEAKRNTVRICNQAKGVKLDRTVKLPKIPDANEKLKEAIAIGMKKRNISISNVKYIKRVKEEYDLICKKEFASYFLIQKYIVDEARRICPVLLGWGDGSEALGCGRGSAPGALVCYLLGITDIDPIKHDLLFSRFLSPSRGGKSIKYKYTCDLIPA